MDFSKLSIKRKADRQVMAQALVDALTPLGAVCEIEDRSKKVYADGSSNPKSREVMVHITAPGGAHISIEFDGDAPSSLHNVFVDTWQAPRHERRWLSPSLGDVNPHHFGKLNRVCYGMISLIDQMKRDIAAFSDGSGYIDESHPKIAAMRERYRQQDWLWYGEAA